MSLTIEQNQQLDLQPTTPIETGVSVAVEKPLVESVNPTTTPSSDPLSVVDVSTPLNQPEPTNLPRSISIPETQPLKFTPNFFEARRTPTSAQCSATVEDRRRKLGQAA